MTGSSDMVRSFAKRVRRVILEQSKRANVGHIGSALSVADVVAALYSSVLRGSSPADPDRDWFVLSKGHAALALYAALFAKGWLNEEQLQSFCANGSLMGVHPEHTLPGIEFSTGSLGQGITFAVGAALGARLQGAKRRIFALISDAECNEGSVWEAAMFAAHHHLGNLVLVVDLNGRQAMGRTRDIIDLDGMDRRWEAFGWNVLMVDGHDPDQLVPALENDTIAGRPLAVIASTTFGKGVSFMENQLKWHYWPMSDHEFHEALAQVEANS